MMFSVCFLLAVIVTSCYATSVDDEHRTPGDGQCMREWLKIAGAQTSSLNSLEEKAHYYQLSESKIRQEHKAILKLLLPANVVEKLKVCTGNPSSCGHEAPCHAGQCEYNTTADTHVCVCPSGFQGDECETDINECASGNHGCDIAERAICNNTHGSYLCHCRHGYCGEDGTRCEDVNECEKGTHGCHGNATCSNVVGSYSCSCVDGFSGDGFHCDEIVCTEKNSQSKLCRQVESMRQQLVSVREQLNVIPQLEEKLQEQQKLLSSTSDTIITLSKALRDTRQSLLKSCHGIAAWKYYPWVNWADGGENKELRKVTYNKTRNDTILRVAFHSILSQAQSAQCGEWYIKFLGNECTQPAPITTSFYHGQGYAWISNPAELSGFCNATSSTFISTGPVTISVHVRPCPGTNPDSYTGAGLGPSDKMTSSLVVEE